MVGFEVTVNGRLVCTGGIDDFGVLTSILTWVRRRPEQSRDGKTIEEELTLDLNALDSRDPKAAEHLKWLSQSLRVGDSISIRIVDTQTVSPPVERRAEDPDHVAPLETAVL